MLTELAVQNFALVESVRLDFGAGLAILTGETGAGKSILLDALGMALGDRVGAESIRHGADKARVEAVFAVGDGDVRLTALLENAGIETDEGTLILAREVTTAGKSSVRINGRAATLSTLRAIGDALVDIHGQHEHQSLLATERHIEILDAWCGADVDTHKAEVAALFSKVSDTAKELEALRADARERVRTLDLLAYQCEEIDTAAPRVAEEDELLTERTRLASAERLFAAAGGAVVALRGGEGRGATTGAVDLLAQAVRDIETAAALDETLAPLLESLQTALYSADDAARDARAYRDGVEFNPARLEEIENRLDTLKTLKRKYGETLEEVIAYRAEIGERLETLTNAEERIAELVTQEAAARKELDHACAKLTKARQKGAKPFADAILRFELKDLAMAATRFTVGIEPKVPAKNGADAVEFLISPNPGVPLKPLAKIASGGEISRIMLAMKGVLSRILSVPTLVFDEVDAGIGGRTGTVLGEKLAHLSHTAQVLCITHLPQVAARGSRHFQIEKRAEKGETIVSVRELSGDDRVREIARMLGGEETDTVLTHAREMLSAK